MKRDDYTFRLLLAANGDEVMINRILDCCGPIGDFTLIEIGSILGITRERVRQIESTAIKKLKHPKTSRDIKRYMAEQNDPDMCLL